jgi:hypothetical protein
MTWTEIDTAVQVLSVSWRTGEAQSLDLLPLSFEMGLYKKSSTPSS